MDWGKVEHDPNRRGALEATMELLCRIFVIRQLTLVFVGSLTLIGGASAACSPSPNLVTQWDIASLQGIRDSKLGAPMAARALAIVHTCMYDAWSAYDDHATSSQASTQVQASAVPSVTITIAFTGSKSAGDNLSFGTSSGGTDALSSWATILASPFGIGILKLRRL